MGKILAKKMQLSDITSFQEIMGRGKIYRVTYIKINMKLGLLNVYKVCFGASEIQITRFEAVKKI